MIKEKSNGKTQAQNPVESSALLDQLPPIPSESFSVDQFFSLSLPLFSSQLRSRLQLLLADVERFRLSAGLLEKPPRFASIENVTIRNVFDEVQWQNQILEAYENSGWIKRLRLSAAWSNARGERRG